MKLNCQRTNKLLKARRQCAELIKVGTRERELEFRGLGHDMLVEKLMSLVDLIKTT